ncbi:MAG: 30S ribosomal protein S1 [Elusimicrobia bacterium]|nr:30S ribosomal protein S1 [Elusimicrobiota bacterium]
MDEKKDINNSKEHISEQEMKMSDIMGPEIRLEEGKILEAKIVGENSDGFLVDLGIKSEALILKSEFEPLDKISWPKPGDLIRVVVVQLRSDLGYPIVSYKKILSKETWEKIFAIVKTDSKIEGTVKRKIKGGFIVDIGVDAFLPLSQADIRPVRKPEEIIGKKFQFLITETNREKRNVVLSRRKLLEEENKKTKNEVLSKLFEGQIIEGKVSSIAKFGAFVDIGGIEGLVHISDLAWHHVKKVEDILKIGQTVSVKILKIDKSGGKLSLGMKHLSPRPWDTAVERYPEGLIVKGKVKSVTSFGIFLEIEPGLEGLIHESEISWADTGTNYKKMFSVGQEVEAKIISIDPKNEKMALSIKRMKINPWEEAYNRYSPGTKVKARITKIMPFGAQAKLDENVEGLIKVSDISWDKVYDPKDVLKVGETVDVVVMEINPQTEKIIISIKNLTEDPLQKYKIGKIVTGRIKKITEFGLFVELEPKLDALLRQSETGLKKEESVGDHFKVGQTIEAKVIKADLKERKIDISVKKLDRDREKELVKKYSNKNEHPKLGEILEEEN